MRAAARVTVLAVAALAGGCPIDPTINPVGLACRDPGDPCPAGYACVGGACQPGAGPAVDAGADGGPALCSLADGGVRGAGGQLQYYPCTTDQDCACSAHCVVDAALRVIQDAGPVCEEDCATTADCVEAADATCQAGHCAKQVCGAALADGGPVDGTLDGPCNSEDAGDGSCVPAPGTLNGSPYGFCRWGGAAGPGMPCGGNGRIPQIVCRVGLVCTGDGGTFCEQLCNPDALPDAGCPGGTSCQPAVGTFIFTCR